jgi:HEAT repeat protein
LLKDPDEGMRIAAARVLVKRGDMAGRTVLLQALQDPDSHHRIDAVLALQQTADPEILAAIKQAAKMERHPLAHLVFKKVLKQLDP